MSMTTKTSINRTDPSFHRPLRRNSSDRPQKLVTFCPRVTIKPFPSYREMPNARETPAAPRSTNCTQFDQLRRNGMARCKGNDSQDKTASVINSNGEICLERRIQQRITRWAVLSYQRRLQERIEGSAPTSVKFTPLLSQVSLKLSQRAKDVSLETARQTYLEVYPFFVSSSNVLPIQISEYPAFKRKTKRAHSEDFGCNDPLKHSRHT
mmetsp:Transcript_4870/g.10734  ORF Transcript_4870/g.10734 Transcript_4870/m.10734 type:complete len:209 (+) Transcript_4870:138-764(+)